MEIIWFGNSSFLIKNSTGKRLFLDPFLHNNNLEVSSLIPNIITISHNHFDSNLLNKFKDSSKVISSTGEHNLEFCKVIGYETYHDNCNGTKRGNNIIYKIIIDDISLLHLGSLGHSLNDDLIKNIGKIDILFIPIGGHITITGETASKIARQISPSIVIPMSYRTINGPFYLYGPQSFIKKLNVATFTKENPFILNKSDLTDSMKVFIIK